MSRAKPGDQCLLTFLPCTTVRAGAPPPHTRAVAGNCSSETQADFHTCRGERMCPVILSGIGGILRRGQSPRGSRAVRVGLGKVRLQRLSQRESADCGVSELTLYLQTGLESWLCPSLVVRPQANHFTLCASFAKPTSKGYYGGA